MVAVAGASALVLYGCSDEFLTPAVPATLTADALTTPAGIEGALIGAYSQLSGLTNRLGGTYNWVSGSIQGGEANKGTEDGDFVSINEVVQYKLQTTSAPPSDKWRGLYNGVVASNQAMRIAIRSEDPNVRDAFRNNMIGQALFLRTHYYWNLYMHFQNFSYFDETVDPLEYSLQPNVDNSDKLLADMERAASLLPETQRSVGMVNKWAALAYLGKMQVHKGNFAAGAATLDNVISNGVTSGGTKYALLANYGDLFNAEFDNNSESIFAIQAAANTGSVNNANYAFDLSHLQGTPIGGCCGFWQPSFDLVDSYRTGDDGLPFVDGSYRDPSKRLKTDLGVESSAAFTVDTKPVDPRLDHAVGRRGIPFLDWGLHEGKKWIRDQKHAGPYSPKKIIYRKSQTGTLQDGSSWTAGYTALNYNLIRLADVILLAAEAHAQTGNIEKARTYVNQIRKRAANESSWVKKDDGSNAANYSIKEYPSFSGKEDALNKIYFERKLELSNEGHRFFDLVRWGRAETFIPGYIDYEKQFLQLQFGNAEFNPNQDRYYPIPQGQIDIQPGVLSQNEGYR